MKKNLIPFGLAIVLILVMGITYYFAVQLPRKQLAEIELAKIESLKQERRDMDAKLTTCLEEASLRHKQRWNNACETLGRKVDDDRLCGLPSDQAVHYDSEYKGFRDECILRYK